MLVFVLASAALSAAPAPRAASATAQATATIRVISAVRLKLDGRDNAGAPPVRSTLLRLADGAGQPAKLIEFQ